MYCDYHMHSSFSADSVTPMEDMVKRSIELGIKEICFTEHVDYSVIKENQKPFFGYSDLSVVLNALNSKTGMKTYLYQIRNIIDEYKEEQKMNFCDSIMNDGNALMKFDYKWIQ